MTALQAIAATFVLVVFGSSAAAEPSSSWLAKRCSIYGAGYCRVPFNVALVNANGVASESIKVQLRGYLVKEDEGYVLYESKSAAQRGWRTDAILINPGKREDVASSLSRLNQSNVVIQGRFLLEAPNDEYWVQFIPDSPVLIAAVVGERLRK